MATISRAPSGRWRAQVRRAGQPEQSRSFDRFQEAKQWAAQIEGALASGPSLLLADGLKRYLAEETPKKRGASQEINRIKAWLRHPLAKMPLSAIRRCDLAAWRDEQTEKGSAPSAFGTP